MGKAYVQQWTSLGWNDENIYVAHYVVPVSSTAFKRNLVNTCAYYSNIYEQQKFVIRSPPILLFLGKWLWYTILRWPNGLIIRHQRRLMRLSIMPIVFFDQTVLLYCFKSLQFYFLNSFRFLKYLVLFCYKYLDIL